MLCELDGRSGTLSKLLFAWHNIRSSVGISFKSGGSAQRYSSSTRLYHTFASQLMGGIFFSVFISLLILRVKVKMWYLSLFFLLCTTIKNLILKLWCFLVPVCVYWNMACCYLNTNVNRVVLQKLYHIYLVSAASKFVKSTDSCSSGL